MSQCLSDEEVLVFAIGRLPAARQAEAHAHLDQCDTCQQLLSEAAHALATATTLPLQDSEPVILTTMFRPGMLVAQRYLIRRFIARGGMGEVYEAFDQDLQQRIALKTVTATASDSPAAVRKLKDEVQLARRVSHTNVCRIYDLGRHVVAETGAKVSFLTMEFVEGETLGQRIRLGGALPVAEARKLGRELLEGLKAAHDSGVLHRDFKSDNVMLCHDGEEDTKPIILDFGLARQLDRDATHGNRSSHGAMLGTYGYIAPELVDRPHSKASDVYAFGVVWFEMLTGELPFASSSSTKALSREGLEPTAPAPSTKNPLVPRALDAVVLGCLRRSPKDRFRTAGEALAALDAMESREREIILRRKWAPRVVAGALVLTAVYFGIANRYQMARPAESVAMLSPASPAQAGSASGLTPAGALGAARANPGSPPAASAEPVPSGGAAAPLPPAADGRPSGKAAPASAPKPAPATSPGPAQKVSRPLDSANPFRPPPPAPLPPVWEPFPSGDQVDGGDVPHHS